MNKIQLFAASASLSLVVAGVACGDGPDDPATSTSAATPSAAAGTPIVLASPTVTASGLQYVDDVVGTGDSPAADSMVRVNYVGRHANTGAEFDRSPEGGYSFPMAGGVIPGFAEAVSTMKVGGKRTAYLPAAIAYGATGRAPAIEPNEDLVFEIELVAIEE